MLYKNIILKQILIVTQEYSAMSIQNSIRIFLPWNVNQIFN